SRATATYLDRFDGCSRVPHANPIFIERSRLVAPKNLGMASAIAQCIGLYVECRGVPGSLGSTWSRRRKLRFRDFRDMAGTREKQQTILNVSSILFVLPFLVFASRIAHGCRSLTPLFCTAGHRSNASSLNTRNEGGLNGEAIRRSSADFWWLRFSY